MTDIEIPVEIVQKIEAKRLAITEARAASTQRNEELLREAREKGLALVQASIAKMLENVPEWLHPYDRTAAMAENETLESIGNGYGELQKLRFEIPGLAAILFEPKLGYVCQRAHEMRFNYNGGMQEPSLNFADTTYSTDLEYVLVQAADAITECEEYVADYRDWLKDQADVREQQEAALESQPEPPLARLSIVLTPSEERLITLLRELIDERAAGIASI